MIVEEIRSKCLQMQDIDYRDFQSKLMPTVDPETVIGVRTPQLRSLAKELAGRQDLADFLRDLPHLYFEENQLHAFLVSGIRDMGRCLEEVGHFLPYVDNWATCDQMSPKVFRTHKKELEKQIRVWPIRYGLRFGC